MSGTCFPVVHLGFHCVIYFLAVIIVTLTANTPRLAERVKTLAGATQAATLAVFGILALLALLGVLWFDQAFIVLHKLLFSNDLWLLDPQRTC